MAARDRYDNDILKQLTRIANALEKIERKLPCMWWPAKVTGEEGEKETDESNLRTCRTCKNRDNFKHLPPCSSCKDHSNWEDRYEQNN